MKDTGDLKGHIGTPAQTAHGIWAIVKAAIAAVYNSLWRDTTSDESTDFYIQTGVASVPVDSDATITFDVAFTATPRVQATVSGTNQDATVVAHTPTTTTFKMRIWNRTSGSNCNCTWTAIGRKAR